MNNQAKPELRLVLAKGVASGKGFRAEWTEDFDPVRRTLRFCRRRPIDAKTARYASQWTWA